MPGLEDYASPILRCAVFRRLNPGATISYNVVPVGAAFPQGHYEYEGKATEAVKCEIILADGTYITAFKEIDKREYIKGGWKDVAQTPEQLAKDETKALGRALRDAGIPQRLSELKILMGWIASMNGDVSRETSIGRARPLAVLDDIEAAFPGTMGIADDPADAGNDEPTPEQLLARKFAFLEGPAKAAVIKYAREELGCTNVLRAGEHAEALMAYIDSPAIDHIRGITDEVRAAAAAIDAKHEQQRATAPIYGDEEPF